jgi:hypothetical protein
VQPNCWIRFNLSSSRRFRKQCTSSHKWLTSTTNLLSHRPRRTNIPQLLRVLTSQAVCSRNASLTSLSTVATATITTSCCMRNLSGHWMISGPCKSQTKNRNSGLWKPMMTRSISHGSAKCPNSLNPSSNSSTMLSRRSRKIKSKANMMMNMWGHPNSYSSLLEASRISRRMTTKSRTEGDARLQNQKLKRTRSLNSRLEFKVILMMMSCRLRRPSNSSKCTKNLGLSKT